MTIKERAHRQVDEQMLPAYLRDELIPTISWWRAKVTRYETLRSDALLNGNHLPAHDQHLKEAREILTFFENYASELNQRIMSWQTR